MIRINLLPIRQTQKRQTVQQQLLIGGMLLVVTIIACAVWSMTVSSRVDAKRQQIVQKNNELKQLDKIIGEVNEFTSKKKELEEKLEVIEQLRKGKTGPVKALDDLATEIPNRVWLTEFTESSGSVKIKGYALDHDDVSAFMKSLQKSKYFSGIVLNVVKGGGKDLMAKAFGAEVGRAMGNVEVYQFEITCAVNYSA